MVEEERAKTADGGAVAIQIQSGDVEVAKLQLAARWAERASTSADMEELLKAFHRAYKSIDETLEV